MLIPSFSNDADCVFQPGDVVLTAFGSGVIVGVEAGQYHVRLWRQIGKSISSAALAFLNQSAIKRKIPAAPGLTTLVNYPDSTNQREVLVVAYFPSSDTFLVSFTIDNDHDDSNLLSSDSFNNLLGTETRPVAHETTLETVQLIQVEAQYLVDAPSAKFYPLLETLMRRSDDTVHAAADILSDGRTISIVGKAGNVLRKKVDTITSGDSSTISSAAASIESVVTSTKVDDTVKQVLQLVKDKDLTDLLETCRTQLSLLTDGERLANLSMEGSIFFNAESLPSTFGESVSKSRKAALLSLEQLLEELDVNSADLETLQQQLSSSFAQAFDSLSNAAASDESLSSLFQNIKEKTGEWQSATGRLMETRSGGLFLEGVGRLQQRAAAIFGQGHVHWAGEIGDKLTKSFTEGDVALARLKSIELADAVKGNLVHAIEIRAESVGGLDSIIAGALSQFKEGSTTSTESLQRLLNGLQQGASSAAVDGHETLLAVLSSRSAYRDVALTRIERVLCSLSNQFAQELSPDDIAQIARGDGGTAKLFEPIAKRAMTEIYRQLDSAESSITDPTTLDVLNRVRKITSGNMSLSTVLDDLVNVLDDDSFVRASETFVQQSEQVLDIIEGVSANKVVNDALLLAEKAGITRSTVMNELSHLDVNTLVSTAGTAISDERARQQLLSTATDAALDFVLKILPSMQVPPFDGVKDGLVYHISNLSMEGFQVRKENIQIELAGMRATHIKGLNGASSQSSNASGNGGGFNPIKPTELLIIDVQEISAVLDDAEWSFEQTYMPYLKAQGLANIRFHGGAIRLQFELRKQRKESNPFEWEPVLCLHDRQCSIADVELTLQGESRLAWIINKAATVFKGPLRDYIVRSVANALTSRSGWILQRLNNILSPRWGLIMQTASIAMSDLIETDERVVSKETATLEQSFIELVWRDQLPLGINLLLNDESGHLKVVDFPRGSQARAVCEKKNLDPDIFKGSNIVAVNGSQYGGDLEELFAALKEPGRPKTIRFEIADSEGAERVRLFVAGDDKAASMTSGTVERRSFQLRKLTVVAGEEAGLSFCKSLDDGLVVEGFTEGMGGVVLAAEKSQIVHIGDLLVAINNAPVSSYFVALSLLEEAVKHRPLVLSFADPYMHIKEISKPSDGAGGGEELRLVRKEQKIVITGFNDISGKAERSGIMIGDHLVFVNGAPVGAGCRWFDLQPAPSLPEVQRMISDNDACPMGLTFARPMRGRDTCGSFRDDEAETICVTIERPEELGCVIRQTRNHDLVVADFKIIPGNVQSALRQLPNGLTIQAINGQPVPSYASEDMVRSAIDRSLAGGKVELWLVDNEQREWLRNVNISE